MNPPVSHLQPQHPKAAWFTTLCSVPGASAAVQRSLSTGSFPQVSNGLSLSPISRGSGCKLSSLDGVHVCHANLWLSHS